ncbi:MAG: T9SS C-terminal target domain-containing protein [Bacteroidetes bacterium]|nr:MAG: T9SS C-terminal target domain-containing protein [Bacteroidota bacterium]
MKKNIQPFFTVMFCALLSLTGKAQIFENLSVTACDSVINANYYNPEFVILDVRTPGEYNPQHLEDAININFYDADFSDQLDLLNKEKKYLIHCKSGGRSSLTMNIMDTLGFQEVYNMVGGILSWNAAALPTTDEFAARFMFVSDSIFPLDTVPLMAMDTLKIKITNRGNSILYFEEVSSLADNEEFATDFDLGVQLWGAEDYVFDIVYSPQDELVDTLDFLMVSNVGNQVVNIIRVGEDQSVSSSDPFSLGEWRVYPNPVAKKLYLGEYDLESTTIEMFTEDGRKVFESPKGAALKYIDVSSFERGFYLIRFSKGTSVKTIQVVVAK